MENKYLQEIEKPKVGSLPSWLEKRLQRENKTFDHGVIVVSARKEQTNQVN